MPERTANLCPDSNRFLSGSQQYAFDALTTNSLKIMVETVSMPTALSQSLKRLFFPERANDGDLRADTPAGSLVIAHELLHNLAKQIESHAARAPYPQVAQALQTVAREKHASATQLKVIIETLGGKTRTHAAEPKAGKNHWDRLNLDLHDQITVDDLLLMLELKAGDNSEIAQTVKELQTSQKKHRIVLSDLIAIADPQATQT